MKTLSTCLAACCFAALSIQLSHAQTATMSVSTVAPTLNPDDIANLTSDGTTGNNSTTAIWSDQPGQGQTFTTLSNPTGYTLSALTFGYNGNGGGGGGSGVTWTINIGTYSGSTFTVLDSYTASGVNTSLGNFPTPDFATWTLNTPLTLSANTTYGFQVGTNSSGMILQPASTAYGTAFSTTPAGGATVTGTTPQSFSREFAVALTETAPAPEPSTWAMMLGGLGLLVFCVRRKAASVK